MVQGLSPPGSEREGSPPAPAPEACALPPDRPALSAFERDCSSPSACPDAPRPAHDGLPQALAPASSALPPDRPARSAFERDCSTPSACPDAPHPAHDGVPPAPAPAIVEPQENHQLRRELAQNRLTLSPRLGQVDPPCQVSPRPHVLSVLQAPGMPLKFHGPRI